jgi:hypothetical protein
MFASYIRRHLQADPERQNLKTHLYEFLRKSKPETRVGGGGGGCEGWESEAILFWISL